MNHCLHREDRFKQGGCNERIIKESPRAPAWPCRLAPKRQAGINGTMGKTNYITVNKIVNSRLENSIKKKAEDDYKKVWMLTQREIPWCSCINPSKWYQFQTERPHSVNRTHGNSVSQFWKRANNCWHLNHSVCVSAWRSSLEKIWG